ncbi:hypothetical protein Pr1d_46530 [Bythopirellula goksoeyrii]|uniref:PilZ domain-containing protein n=1 Tax=Bythopirellula goksoeyrii TaxID=1400387 RepID=A0A5B9QI15_9BACT|nr:hypothetical protein Pr1d_46530 [Bythopirellula goksoeyrii]
MLDISHETKLSEEVWQSLLSRTVLPRPIEETLRDPSIKQTRPDSKRFLARRPLHKIAIAKIGDELHACFAKDLSRMGVGFYSPINILPKTLVTLWLPGNKTLQLAITRCRRRGESCFECGSTFQLSTEMPKSDTT